MARILVTDLDNTLFKPNETEPPSSFFPLVRRWRTENRFWLVATGRSADQVFEFNETWPESPDWVIARERYIYELNSEAGVRPYREWNSRLRRLTSKVEASRGHWLDEMDAWLSEKGVEFEFKDGSYHFDTEPEARRAEARLNEMLPAEIEPIRNRIYLSLVHQEVGKGRCLSYLTEKNNWQPGEIVCVGDSANDLDMLDGRFGFASAAVANAEDNIKEAVRGNEGILLAEPGGWGVIELLERMSGE